MSSFTEAFPTAATVTMPSGESIVFPILKMKDWSEICAAMRKTLLDAANARITKEYAKDLELRERARAAAAKMEVTIFEAVDSRRSPEGITRLLTRSLKAAGLSDEKIAEVLEFIPAYPEQSDLAFAVTGYKPPPPDPKGKGKNDDSQNATGENSEPDSSTSTQEETQTSADSANSST